MAFKITQFSVDFYQDRAAVALQDDEQPSRWVNVSFGVKDQSGKEESGLRKEAEKAARKALKDALDALDALSEN